MAVKGSKKPTKAQETAARESARAAALARDKQRSQLWAVVLFATGLLMTAFAVLPFEAAAWDAIRRGLNWLFGHAMYIIGASMIFMAVKRKRRLLTIAILWLICTLLHIIGDAGGGVGWLVGNLLAEFFGRIGSGIIIGVVILVLILILGNITVDSFVKFVTKPVKKTCEFAKAQHEQHKQDAQCLAEARAEALKESDSNEVYAKMKAAEQSIEAEIGDDAARKVENEIKFAAVAAALPPTMTQPPNSRPPSYVSPDKSDSPDSSDSSDNPEIGDDEPPFDVEPAAVSDSSANPVIAAIEEFKADESQEENLREKHEQSLTQSAPEAVSPLAAQSDFDRINALAAFAAHQQMYSLPGVDLLEDVVKKHTDADVQEELDANSLNLIETLKSFGVIASIVGVVRGPSVTRYEIKPATGVKISKITGLQDDIALNLAAVSVRMEAPIPGKAAVGVEVPNTVRDMVTFRELIDSDEFRKSDSDSKLGAALGRDITGEIIISDISKMPHILIAGTTGSGKSVCVNSIVMSILYRATPEEVRLMMIDPKMVEFAIYSGIPHLLTPVVTDPKKAAGALGWAVNEMQRRYSLFAENNVRNIGEFNQKVKRGEKAAVTDADSFDEPPPLEYMAKIVIFIDELADLMMTAAKEVEGSICRLAQLARAAGIHLVIATQRPTTNVVTGLIKANIPSRIGLKVASRVDSQVIFDTAGAEKLLGNGDMLYAPTGLPKPIRVQGCWVSNDEINRVVKHVKDNFNFDYDDDVAVEIERQTAALDEKSSKGGDADELTEFEMDDDKLDEAIEAVIAAGKASTSYLQLKLKLGYGRAARLIDIMEKMGVIGKSTGPSKPREVLMTYQDWLERKVNRG
jgi:S-DNA-T family DNA segregation ATPase FtsK/SpoIIIE